MKDEIPMATKLTFRVVRISEQTREKFRAQRDKNEHKNHEALEAILTTCLPLIESGLAELGFQIGKRQVKVRAARLQFTTEALDLLKSTSAKTGLPQTTLLKAALNRTAPKTRRRKS
jgi:site-specific recombinase